MMKRHKASPVQLVEMKKKLIGEVPLSDRNARLLGRLADVMGEVVDACLDDANDVDQKNALLNAVLIAAASVYTIECPPKHVMLVVIEFFTRQLEQQWTMNKAIRDKADRDAAGASVQ